LSHLREVVIPGVFSILGEAIVPFK
jgi:hypothetical protein